MCSALQEFIEKAEHLLTNSQLRSDLVTNAKHQLLTRHSRAREKSGYVSMVKELQKFYNPSWYDEMVQRREEEEEAVRARVERERVRREELKEEKTKLKYGGAVINKKDSKTKRVSFKQAAKLVRKKGTD